VLPLSSFFFQIKNNQNNHYTQSKQETISKMGGSGGIKKVDG
jgi:hypothetical protein